VPPGGLTSFEVELQGPLDVGASVERFRRWGDDLIDRWDGRTMVRVLRLPAGPVPFAAEPAGTVEHPRLRVLIGDGSMLRKGPSGASDGAASGLAPRGVQVTDGGAGRALRSQVEAALRRMFVQADLGTLAQRDEAIARAGARFPGLRPVLERDPLTALVRSVSAQQINLAFAAVVRRRLVQAFGRRHEVAGHEVWSLDAERLAGASMAAIRELQFTTRKAEYIVGIAQRAAFEPGFFTSLETLPDDEVIARLTTLPGIGRWSAEWYLARTLGRPVVAAGDLGVRKAVGRAYFDGRLPSAQEVRQATAHWGAAAGVAQQLLLETLYQGEQAQSPR
jgi:DNA-3-methyladenine glycosylase II